MAESAVKSAAEWLGKLLVEEGQYLWGVEDKVSELRKELVWMQCFLRDADSLQYDDEIVAQWVLEIKEYVYEAEDIVDKFVIQVASIRRQSGWVNKLKRWSHFGMELFAMHQVASNIDSLIRKIALLTPRLQTYGLKTAYGMKTYRTREVMSDQAQQRMSYAHLNSKNIVGLEEDTTMIVNALLDSKAKRRAVSIYGMGGLGKTTLATKVYNHEEIKKHFTGGCAWAYISKQFQVQNVLQVLLADLTSKSTDLMTGKASKDLIRELREFLQKNRCLVVLDDVWEKEVWDFLYDAFSQGVESGSKVLLTTRKEEVAKHADRDALPKPDPLNDDVSWELLQQTLGWGIDGSDKLGSLLTEMFGNNGTEVIELGKAMVKHCNGIPLAIVVLGGILRKKETVEEWRLVRQNITSYLRRGNDHGRSYMEVLVLSYNDLPYHLKPCFLHLGNFPEDHEIHTEKLYRMWVAEGIITWPRDRIVGTDSLEDIANDYLSDLAQAGMVQITSKGSKGRIKSVRIHDLMRDVCLQKAVAENFLSIVDYRPCHDEPRSITSSSNNDRLLRMAIYLAPDANYYLPDSLTSHEYLRSLLFFVAREDRRGGYEQWIEVVFEYLPWLRVLDMEGLCLKGKLSRNVNKVIHLRYLSLKETDVSELPSSIGKLRFLQTLDLRASSVGSPVRVPNTLWKLERLRHLFLPNKPYEIKKSQLLRLDTLCRLETLKNLEVGKARIEDLQKLRKLKKLSIKDAVSDEESIKIIVESPAVKSGNLRSCSLGVQGSALDHDPSILSSFDCLDRLIVVNKVSAALTDNILPRFLEILHLESCELQMDPMGILGGLCHLKDLWLGSNSFVGKKMNCLDESFPQLVILNLRGLANLELWTVEERSMSRLRKLIMMNCGKLKSIPENLPSSVLITCSPCIYGIEKYGTCICYRGISLGVYDHERDLIVLPEDTGKKLVDLLDRNRKVVLSGSTSGVSKATLANMLYQQKEIWTRFDAIAWARFPHKQATNLHRDFILRILRQLDPEKSDKDLSRQVTSAIEAELQLQNVVQGKKCLIVLTDMKGSVEKSDTIFGCDLPEAKLLVITHEQSTSDSSTHKLTPLSDVESSDLFQKRLEGALSGNEGSIKNELGNSMLKHCSNQALSVIMLAGLLAVKKTLIEWESIEKELTLRMEKAQGGLEAIYAFSYDDLPPHLKHCFLYLAMFPEDTEISARKLYHMWIAAGFVRLKDNEAEAVDLLENVAESYLDELVRRGMVQVGKRRPTGRISTCWVHFLLRDLCSATATKEHFVSVIGQAQPSSSSNERFIPEHLGVHLIQGAREVLENTKSRTDQLRSLLFFSMMSDFDSGESKWGWFIRLCNSFRFLRVLDLEGMWMIKGVLPIEVGNLNQLRYLSLRGTYVSELPLAIELLRELQILDLRVMEILFIPDVLFTFLHLRHLHLPNSFAPKSPKLQLHGLDHLRTLGNLNTEKVDLDCLPELKNLRRITVRNIQAEKELDEKLKYITVMDLSINSDIFNGNPNIISSFQNLHKATIKGEISPPLDAAMFPECLKELTLKHSKLKQDPIRSGKLPGLTHLFLDHNAFIGQKITFAKGGFPRLTHLKLRMLSNLEELDMTEAESCLRLEVTDCWRLKKIKPVAAQTRVGPLKNHPLLGLLRHNYKQRRRL